MSKINNYEELMAERKKIEHRIFVHKQIINEGVSDIKDQLKPILSILNIFNKKTPNSPLWKFVSSLAIDLFVGQKFLLKSNWLTRFLVPMVLKGVSALAIGSNKSNGHEADIGEPQDKLN